MHYLPSYDSLDITVNALNAKLLTILTRLVTASVLCLHETCWPSDPAALCKLVTQHASSRVQAQEGAPVVSVVKPIPHVGALHQPGGSGADAAHQAERSVGDAQQAGSNGIDAQQADSGREAAQQPVSSSGDAAQLLNPRADSQQPASRTGNAPQQADLRADPQQPASSSGNAAQQADSSSTANEMQAAWALWQNLQELLTVQRYWWKQTVFR